MVRDYRHETQEMVRDCRPTTGDGHRLQAYYRRWSETAYIVQEMVRGCRPAAEYGQTMGTLQEMMR